MALSATGTAEDLAPTRGLSGRLADNTRSLDSAVSRVAIVAGAVVAASLCLMLLIPGVGLGLPSGWPWVADGVSATTFGASMILGLAVSNLLASATCGYLAGRLDIQWAEVHTDEVRYRDTDHGFATWAVTSLATAALLTFAIESSPSGDEQPGTSIDGDVAGTAGSAMGSAATAAVMTAIADERGAAIRTVLHRSQQSRLDGMVPTDPNSPRALLVRDSFDALVGALEIPASVALLVVRGEVVAETILGRIVVANEALGDLAEGERRFVLAHELGHIRLGHWRHIEMLYEKWIPGPVTPERTDPIAADLGREASALAHQQEFDADAYAVRASRSLGDARQAAVASFVALGARTDTITHPGTLRRVAALQSIEATADAKP